MFERALLMLWLCSASAVGQTRPPANASLAVCSASGAGGPGSCPAGTSDTAQIVLGPDGKSINGDHNMTGISDEHRQYSLPPDKLKQAIQYSQARYWLHFTGSVWGIAVLFAILASGAGAKFRDWASGLSRRRFVQVLVFVPLLALANDILNLPVGIYGQHLDLAFQQSIQTWPSWLWDWTKGELLEFGLAVVLVFLLFAVMRRSPRRWWLYFWLAALPILGIVAFAEPLVVEPLFYKFEPLSSGHRALVDELERVVARAGLDIPRERMFEMKASEKTNSLNAYVTGFGASKRVVVWDTTIQRLTTAETVSVFGHEMGHYVLGHVQKTLIFLSLLVLILLFAGYHLLAGMIRRWGAAWRVREVSDWASLPALLLLFSIFSFLTEPLVNAYSRQQEHEADLYGLEVIHGIVPHSRQVTAHSFQVLGEVDLDEPNPNKFIEFWMYTHPSISERIEFTNTYDPWSRGNPKYVK